MHCLLGNYQETLNDVKAAIELEPTFIKAIERGVISFFLALSRYINHGQQEKQKNIEGLIVFAMLAFNFSCEFFFQEQVLVFNCSSSKRPSPGVTRD